MIIYIHIFISVCLCILTPSVMADDLSELRNELLSLKAEYQQKIQQLEEKITNLETSNTRQTPHSNAANAFNPSISLVLDGSYADYSNEQEEWRIEGFPLGGEAGLAEQGFSIGHTELAMSANVDDKFYGKITMALDEHDGEAELELEEAFFQTLGLGAGVTLRGGRFFSGVGYLNQQHDHAWDFSDAPLVYAAIFGNKYIDDGIRVSWIAPVNLYTELGFEALRGSRFPGGGDQDGVGSRVVFINTGADLGISHSWQAGLSYLDRTVSQRSSAGHIHEDAGNEETPLFSGDSNIVGFNLVYKWAPNGYGVERNFKLQFEYFNQDESGHIIMANSNPLEMAQFEGDQSGYYLQAIYQFNPAWRFGLRYDHMESDNAGQPNEIIVEAGLVANGFDPKRLSTMLEWVPSEFSRIRLQYNRDESYRDTDNQLLIQYTFSLGDHRSHPY